MTTSRSLRPFRFSWIVPSVAALLVVQACADRASDCDANSNCTGGTTSAGSSAAGKGGTPGDAGAENGGSASGKSGSTGASGKGGNTSGGAASVGGAGEGGSEAGAGGVPVTPPCGGDCPSGKPVCKETTDTCVQCLMPSDCTVGTKTKCDTTANNCVECIAAVDCTDAKAAKCDAGTCAKCTTNDDCAHVAGKTVCDTKAGECVQCTASDESKCGGKSCNPATKSCTTTPVGTRGPCEACLADSECIGGNKADADSRCVPMTFNGSARPGGFCLRRVSKTCAKPFQIPINAASLSAAAKENYCGIDQDNVRCEAILDLGSDAACADGKDTSCGCARDVDGKCTDTGAGGLCRTVGVNDNRCTYSCGTVADCPNGKTCTLADPYCH